MDRLLSNMLLYVPEYIFPGLRDNLFEHLDGIYNGADTSLSRVQNCGSGSRIIFIAQTGLSIIIFLNRSSLWP